MLSGATISHETVAANLGTTPATSGENFYVGYRKVIKIIILIYCSTRTGLHL